MNFLEKRWTIKWYWNILIIFVGFVICGSMIWFTFPFDPDPIEPWYHYQYKLSISTNQSGNYSIIVPAIVHNQIFYDNQFNYSSSRNLFNRLNEFNITNGGKDTSIEKVITPVGRGLRISGSNNISLEINITGNDWDSHRDAEKIMLGTTYNNNSINRYDYKCWIFFDNKSEVQELNFRLRLYVDHYFENRTIIINTDFYEHGWLLIPGEYSVLYI